MYLIGTLYHITSIRKTLKNFRWVVGKSHIIRAVSSNYSDWTETRLRLYQKYNLLLSLLMYLVLILV